jgi:outer membrane protein OmpA-like peptidoglycan-associated protein
MAAVKALAEYARASKSRNILVKGFSAVSQLSDGQSLTEGRGLARERAEKIANIMQRLGVDRKRMTVLWQDQPIAGTGRDDWRNRKVEIQVTP